MRGLQKAWRRRFIDDSEAVGSLCPCRITYAFKSESFLTEFVVHMLKFLLERKHHYLITCVRDRVHRAVAGTIYRKGTNLRAEWGSAS